MPKREGHLIERIAQPENLRLAFCKATRGKADRADVHEFRAHLHDNLAEIRDRLLAASTIFGPYTYFHVYDPKKRLIAVAPFRDRVTHHAIINICEPVFERYCIFDTYACRVDKGAQRAVSRARHFARRFPWFLKLDVRKYFDSIPHDGMLTLLERRFKDPRLLRIFDALLDSYDAGPARGLPIGNLTSQHFANAYLGQLDHYLKDERGVHGYVRYMDDMAMWAGSRAFLKHVCAEVQTFAEDQLGLQIKDNVQLNRSCAGMTFLGYRVFPGRILLSPRSRRRYARKLKAYLCAWRDGIWSEQYAARRIDALTEFTRFADSSGFRQSLVSRLDLSEWGHDPRARTGSNAAATGTTPLATARRATATATTRTTGTTTSGSGSSCPQLAKSAGARTIADPGRVPFPPPGGTKTPASPGQVGTTERAGEAPTQQQPLLFQVQDESEPEPMP